MGRAAVDPLRITIAVPDRGVVGAYQRIVQQVVHGLRGRGHRVTVAAVRTNLPINEVLNRIPSKRLEQAAPEFLAHMTQLSAFRRLDLSDADLAISTLPPSQGIRHDRHLALFFHHDRPFYDLSDSMVSAGLAHDGELHRQLSALVREADQLGMDGVTRFSVPSRSVQKRLRDFNRVDRVFPFHPGVTSRRHEPGVDRSAGRTHVLCVSPHEFPQRTELFVQAAHLLPGLPAISVGDGSRLEWARRVDRSLDRVSAVAPETLWRRPPDGALPIPRWQGSPLVTFIPWARPGQLDSLYRQAKCVVAPALQEDYGLAVLEAMSWGTPAVVCTDGGSRPRSSRAPARAWSSTRTRERSRRPSAGCPTTRRWPHGAGPTAWLRSSTGTPGRELSLSSTSPSSGSWRPEHGRHRGRRPAGSVAFPMSLRETVSSPQLLWNLTLRELRTRYRRSALGWTWSMLNPLASMIIYTIVFVGVFKAKPPTGVPSGLKNFPLYLLCGLLPWTFFANSVTTSMVTLIGSGGLLKKVWFPAGSSWSRRPSRWRSRWRSSSASCPSLSSSWATWCCPGSSP